MSAIARLCRLLDERGVGHEDTAGSTVWEGSDGTRHMAAHVYPRGSIQPSDERLVLRCVATPERAIAATLGGTDATDARQGVAGEYVYGTDGREGNWLTGERIVRCRDCRWAREAPPQEGWHLECGVRPLCRHYTPDGGYCHLGERREDA